MYKYFHLSQNLCVRKSCPMGTMGKRASEQEIDEGEREFSIFSVIASSSRRRNARFKCKKHHWI